MHKSRGMQEIAKTKKKKKPSKANRFFLVILCDVCLFSTFQAYSVHTDMACIKLEWSYSRALKRSGNHNFPRPSKGYLYLYNVKESEFYRNQIQMEKSLGDFIMDLKDLISQFQWASS